MAGGVLLKGLLFCIRIGNGDAVRTDSPHAVLTLALAVDKVLPNELGEFKENPIRWANDEFLQRYRGKSVSWPKD